MMPEGSTAITPRPGDFDAVIPAFTRGDVLRYQETHGGLPHTSFVSRSTAAKVASITERELRAMNGGSGTGCSPDTLLCYGELDGSFGVSCPPRPGTGACGTTAIISGGYEVFHAHTGNLLICGGPPLSTFS
jgi:hypothetical protein